jgi:hypothetical protein
MEGEWLQIFFANFAAFAPNKKYPAVSRGVFGVFRIFQEPTLASSSLFSTFTILNCSACIPVSARKESLPK